jgi:hypothetical protein
MPDAAFGFWKRAGSSVLTIAAQAQEHPRVFITIDILWFRPSLDLAFCLAGLTGVVLLAEKHGLTGTPCQRAVCSVIARRAQTAILGINQHGVVLRFLFLPALNGGTKSKAHTNGETTKKASVCAASGCPK